MRNSAGVFTAFVRTSVVHPTIPLLVYAELFCVHVDLALQASFAVVQGLAAQLWWIPVCSHVVQVINNPRSFGQTVENLFTLSFLVRNGRAMYEYGSDGSVDVGESMSPALFCTSHVTETRFWLYPCASTSAVQTLAMNW